MVMAVARWHELRSPCPWSKGTQMESEMSASYLARSEAVMRTRQEKAKELINPSCVEPVAGTHWEVTARVACGSPYRRLPRTARAGRARD